MWISQLLNQDGLLSNPGKIFFVLDKKFKNYKKFKKFFPQT